MRAGLVAIALAFAAAGACDPVHDAQRSSLDGETRGVPTGPLHRPGQPCLVCHDGSLGNPPKFSVAGTVYQNAGDTVALDGATVTLTAADGTTFATVTNSAGNFYVNPDDFDPSYPMHVSITYGSTTTTMQSHVGRDGSCAGCHKDPAAPDSPGHVYFNAPDGGVP